MVELGEAHGVRTTALLTQMDVPLGRTAGNALEVVEAVEVLAGGGPSDVVELTLDLAREMLDLAGLGRRRSGRRPGRRPGHGRVAADGAGPGRRPGRACCPAPPRSRSCRRRPPAPSPASTPWRSASPPGGSAPAAAARRTTSPPPRAWCGAPPSATTSRQGQPLLELHLDDPTRLESAQAALARRHRDHRRTRHPTPARPRTGRLTRLCAKRRMATCATDVGGQRLSTWMGSMPSASGRAKPRTWA